MGDFFFISEVYKIPPPSLNKHPNFGKSGGRLLARIFQNLNLGGALINKIFLRVFALEYSINLKKIACGARRGVRLLTSDSENLN